MGRRQEAPEKILQAASRLFWRYGYHAVSVDLICSQAGINKGSLYHYHRDKKDLAVAVVQRNARIVENTIQSLPREDPRNRILGYFDFMVELQLQQREESGRIPGCPFGKLANEVAGESELAPINEAVQEWFESMHHFLGNELLSIAPAGFGPARAQRTARELLMLWQGALLLAQSYNSLQHLTQARKRTNKTIQNLT